jgi:hypothetical protein
MNQKIINNISNKQYFHLQYTDNYFISLIIDTWFQICITANHII